MRTAVIAVLGIAVVFIGWTLLIILPAFRTIAWSIMSLGSALIAFALVVDFRRVRGALASRRGRFGIGTTVVVALFVGIVLLANAISIGSFHRFDFTGLSQFTLTSQTKEVLSKLETPIEVTSFLGPGVPYPVSSFAMNLLAEYENHTDRLTVREVDPDLRPDMVRELGVGRYGAQHGVIVFRGHEGQRLVFGPEIVAEAEHAFTSAILEVTGVRQKRVYFLVGHGQASIHHELGNARSGLRDNLFWVGEIDLLVTPDIPDDLAVLVIAGPQQSPTSVELGVIREYLTAGGRALVLLDPNPPHSMRQFLSEWQIGIEDGILVDPASYVAPHIENVFVPRTRNAFSLAETYFPGATAIIPGEPKERKLDLSALLWTSPDAWLQRSFVPGEEPVYNEEVDRAGPLAIGALLSWSSGEESDPYRETRLVVIGDSDFARDPHFWNGNNRELFLTAVNWLAADERIVSVDRRALVTRRLLLSPEQARFLHFSSIGLLPLILGAIGVYVWWRRRR